MAQTFAQQAYEHIREKLLLGEYQPGMRLRYGVIGKEIGSSATPVREAMGKLATEGLVELVPDLGAVVRTLSREEAIELYQMRAALEPCAAAWAVENLCDGDMDELQSLLDRMLEFGRQLRRSGKEVMPEPMRREYAALELAFHMTIIEASNNRTLIRIVGDFHILARALGADPTRFDIPMVIRAYRDHRRVLRALKRRDAAAARQAMEQHMQMALDMVLEAYNGPPQQRRWWSTADSRQKSGRIDRGSDGSHRTNARRRGASPIGKEA